jgi:hypothetical protein
MTTLTEPEGSAKIVHDYDLFREGDFEPHLGKKIDTLIYKTTTFIVYLDEDLYVEWAFTPKLNSEWSRDVGVVLNRVSLVQALPASRLSTEQLRTFRQLVGEAVARVLQYRDGQAANDALDNAVAWLEARNKESARWLYLMGSCAAAGVAGIATTTLWVFRDQARLMLGPDVFESLLGTGCGGIGAWLSILLGSKNLPLDSAADSRVHFFEGMARVVAGAVGATLVALGIKSELLLSVISSSSEPLTLLAAICMVAGASERLVPDFIERVEIGGAPREDEKEKTPPPQ